ncbi:MAG TPA: glutamate--cysteine ligase [Thiotrichales bacterium]|nr:glutamate--cysteine ligase [Thiotrichales bacterium]
MRERRIGLEKESLRVDRHGRIAQTPHPASLGRPLAHPWITTDYSEALLEFITPPFPSMDGALHFLREAHQFVYRHLNDELLWATSMPCVIEGENSIPIARYGDSNPGRMKTVYRRGLGHRYGRIMQVIAGVHYNYSLPDVFWEGLARLEGHDGPLSRFRSDHYFAMLRNLQRLGWLIPYLFGASPAVCRSFLQGKATSLTPMDNGTFYEPWATSLRMGDIGYQNNQENETGIKARYDSLEAYVESLRHAIHTPCPRYEAIGVVVDGEYRQLNANILQIENEYYSTVRPKPRLKGDEPPSRALLRGGVAYIELRSLDVNAFDPVGINREQLRFLDALMLFCLLHESPLIDCEEQQEIDSNEMESAHRGRDPRLRLRRRGEEIPLRQWALEVLDAMEPICRAMDADREGNPYQDALRLQRRKVLDPDLTPSARMLAEMRDRGESFFEFAWRMSRQHQRHLLSLPYSERIEIFFTEAAKDSEEAQRRIEEEHRGESFQEYLERYFSAT